MEKTEKLTAQQIMFTHFEVKNKTEMMKNQFIGLGAQGTIVKAMHEYAAQELDAYKARLEEELIENMKAEHDKARNQTIQDCIDIVSVTPGDENVIPKLESLRTKQITSD